MRAVDEFVESLNESLEEKNFLDSMSTEKILEKHYMNDFSQFQKKIKEIEGESDGVASDVSRDKIEKDSENMIVRIKNIQSTINYLCAEFSESNKERVICVKQRLKDLKAPKIIKNTMRIKHNNN